MFSLCLTVSVSASASVSVSVSDTHPLHVYNMELSMLTLETWATSASSPRCVCISVTSPWCVSRPRSVMTVTRTTCCSARATIRQRVKAPEASGGVLFVCQYLYFCTSKADMLHAGARMQLFGRESRHLRHMAGCNSAVCLKSHSDASFHNQ